MPQGWEKVMVCQYPTVNKFWPRARILLRWVLTEAEGMEVVFIAGGAYGLCIAKD